MRRTKTTTEDFIRGAKAVHGERYDYSQAQFTGWCNPITIICKEHGAYRQKAHDHYKGRNCPICAGKRSTQEIFIAKSKEIHGNKYDYSKVNYVNWATKVCIICPVHGEFWQSPNSHLGGHGCFWCGREATGKKASLTDLEAFIKRAREVHGDKYDYSLVDLKNHTTKVRILCPKHGIFEQTPSNHLYGQGCMKCGHEVHRGLIGGIGKNDIKEESARGSAYLVWCAMIKRCHKEEYHKKQPTYSDCSVCDEWLTFSNFKKWHDNPENGFRDGYHLDKDILIKGNRVYSPETCCFVPAFINDIFVIKPIKSNGLPTGVYAKRGRNGRFYAAYGRYGKTVRLGGFNTVEDAHAAYIRAKNAYIKEVATDYFNRGEITRRVYEAMMSREF